MAQKQLAYLLGVDVATVSRWERAVSMPNLASRAAIARIIAPENLPGAAIKRLVTNHTKSCYLLDANGRYLAASECRAANVMLSPSELTGTDFMSTVRSEEVGDAISSMGGYRGLLDRGFACAKATVSSNGTVKSAVTEVVEISGVGACFLVTQVADPAIAETRLDIKMVNGRCVRAA